MASPNRIDRQTEKKASFEDEVEFDNLDFDLEEEIDFGEEEVETTPSVASEQPNSYNDDGDDLIEY
jgi:hypothetical protein